MLPLEDKFYDILAKAKKGLHLSDRDIVQATGISEEAVKKIFNGKLTSEIHLKKIAKFLNLAEEALLAIAQNKWSPKAVMVEGLRQFSSAWDETSVNAYLVWNKESRAALAFDTGTDAQEMLNFLKSNQLKLNAIFITHTHGDHVFELDRIQEVTQAVVWMCEKERLEGAKSFEPEHCFALEKCKVETRLTNGHSPGGITYFLRGLSQPVAFVGDALFAGSMGGVSADYYQDARKKIRDNILTLSDETVLCPGHGPMTTVGEEKRHNPFFAAEFFQTK